MIYILLIGWFIGAALTIKAEAIYCKQPSDYWCIGALLFWWFIAILIITTKHEVCSAVDDQHNHDYSY